MVSRVLLIVNRAAATGHSTDLAMRLFRILHASLAGSAEAALALVDDHPQARACAKEFLADSSAPAAILSAGGGGTLRAVVEGVWGECGPGAWLDAQRLRLGILRMGSGNLVAKQLGSPRDPEAAVKGLAANLLAGRTVPCCIIAIEAAGASGSGSPGFEHRHQLLGVAMGGFGQFGRVPGDLARLHRRWPGLRRLGAVMLGAEQFTNMEYGLCLLCRTLAGALVPSRIEEVEVTWRDRTERLRLLAGALLSFPIGGLPFDPGLRVEDAAVSLHLIPYRGWWQALGLVLFPCASARDALQFRIEGTDTVELRLLDRAEAEFFLDEDPQVFAGHLKLKVAGTLAFVPGPEYKAR
jgi:hypothetical protein